jgi:site-specific recombinase XerD
MKKYKSPLFFKYTYKFLHEYLVNNLNRSRQTEDSYTDALTLFNRYSIAQKGLGIDKLRFDHISKDFILDFRVWLSEKQNNKPQTVNQRIAAINSYLRFASGENISLSSIRISIANIPRLRAQKPKVEGISVKALKTIFDSIPNTKKGRRNLTLLVLLYDSGARINEILKLKVKDIQLNQQYSHLYLLGKGNKSREVPLSKATVKLLKNYIKEFKGKVPNPDEYMFHIARGNIITPLSYDCVDKFLKKYGKIASKNCSEVPLKLSLHKFRQYGE